MMGAPYLSEAPIYEDALTTTRKDTDVKNIKVSDVWKRHIDSVTETIGLVVRHDRFNSSKQETPVFCVISMTQAERNDLQNAYDGMVIYNTTTNRFNFREAGAWVTFAPIPA
jgi:hypothetical protein